MWLWSAHHFVLDIIVHAYSPDCVVVECPLHLGIHTDIYPFLLSRSSDSRESPVAFKREKSRTELIRQLSKQKATKVDEEMPEPKKDTLIEEEKAAEGMVSHMVCHMIGTRVLPPFEGSL